MKFFKTIKEFVPRSLFARSLLIIVIPALLVQVVTTAVFLDNHWRKISSKLAFSVAGEVAIISDEVDGGVSEQRFGEMSDVASQKLDLLISYEPDKQLTPEIVSTGTWEPFTVDALSKALDAKVRRPYSLSFSPQDNWVNIGVQLNKGVLRVLVLERRLFSSSAYIFLLWMVGSSILLFATAILFMRGQIRPIRKLGIIAERMGRGQEIPPFKPEGAREVRQAASAFITMHERISRQIEQRTAMLAGISHDLRTPLTRLKLGLSLLGENEDIDALKHDIADMEKMIGSYLDFVKGEGAEESVMVGLESVLCKVVSQNISAGKNIDVDCPEALELRVKPMAFMRAIQNVIGNALKYGQHVVVKAVREGETIRITIDDDGQGLDPSLYEEVFKPFFRADPSRNSETGGVGLGLPIVRDIVHAHGGEVHIEKSLKGGLQIVMNLPA
ncbi:MAG: ATP-binding protein [Pseudobdellovibrionaceae bacterium]